MARTSAQPGKTQTINFYKINDELDLVDLPGYGYARVTPAEKEKWGKMIENYLCALFFNQSLIDLYWTNGVPKGFEEWLSNNQYQKLIYVRENQKPLLLDSPGL